MAIATMLQAAGSAWYDGFMLSSYTAMQCSQSVYFMQPLQGFTAVRKTLYHEK